MWLRRWRARRRLAAISKAIHSENANAWKILSEVEVFIASNKEILGYDLDMMEQIESIYQALLSAFSDNLGQVSRQLFINLKKLDNTYIDLRCPLSHQHCVYASENITMKIVNEILSKTKVDERTLVVWRYIVIAKLRLDQGDYQSAEFIISALMSASVSMNRLKATYEGLPKDIKKLVKSLEHVALKPDCHILKYRTQPVIPSLARIKKLMTFACSENAAKGKRAEIKAMLNAIQSEVMDQEIPIESELEFFKFDDLIKKPKIKMDDFNKVKYKLSVSKIEKRNKANPTATLFDDFNLLENLDLKINLDKKIHTLLSIYTLIDSFLCELQELEKLQPDNELGWLRRRKLAEINQTLSVFKSQVENREPITSCHHLIDYLQELSESETISNYYFYHSLKPSVKRISLADKLNELVELLAFAHQYQKTTGVLKRQYSKLEKRHHKIALYVPDINESYTESEDESEAKQSGDDRSANEIPMYADDWPMVIGAAVGDIISMATMFDSYSEEHSDREEKERQEKIAIVIEEEISDVSGSRCIDPCLNTSLRSRIDLFESRLESPSWKKQVPMQHEVKNIKPLIRFFDRRHSDVIQKQTPSPACPLRMTKSL